MGRDCRRSVSDLLEEARSPLGPDQVPPCWVLESSKDEGCTAPLGEVSHCWTVLLVEKNLPMSSLALSCFSWCCCLSHHALWQRVWLRFLNNLFIGMSWSLLGPPAAKLSHVQAKPAHLPQHPIMGCILLFLLVASIGSCSRSFWFQGSENWMPLPSSQTLRRSGARRPQDLDDWNEVQSQDKVTGLQLRPRLPGLCSSCPPPATKSTHWWQQVGQVQELTMCPGPSPSVGFYQGWVYHQLEDGTLKGWVSLGSRWPPDRAASQGDGDACGEHWLPRALVCFPKRLHLTQTQTHMVLPNTSAAPSRSVPCQQPCVLWV